MRITAVGQTDIGLVRKKNQDAFGLFPELGLHIIADGMGGRPAGEVASQMTVDLLHQFFINARDKSSAQPDLSLLNEAILQANKKVYEASQAHSAYDGMGTTVVTLVAYPPTVLIGFAGDSRAYLHRGDVLKQLTQDHSLVNEYIKLGILTPEAARTHRLRNVISRGIGVGSTVQPETFKVPVQAGDLFLLCTDGLSNMIDHEKINDILTQARGKGPDIAASALIEGAKEKGGRDNITVVLVSFEA
jgi:protein phosphatase